MDIQARKAGLPVDQWWGLPRRAAVAVLVTVSIGLPALLVLHSVMASRELREMRSIFLREHAAGLAGRLEALPPERLAQGALEGLFETEPALVSLALARDDDDAAAAIRAGRELFRTEQTEEVFRAWVPVHSAGEVLVARIELSARAPDFILVHARHNVLLTAVTGAIVLLVSGFAIWSVNRAARLEKRQLETERLAELGSLSAVLAHEIRNPLGAIKGFAQLARERADARSARPLEAIVRESLRLEALVRSLLLYGKPQQANPRHVSWPAMASDLEAHAREAIGTRPIRLDVGGSLGEFETDPDLLKQALLNLVRNSVEAIPDGAAGTIRVDAAAGPKGTFTITVEDDGSGLKAEVRDRLFSPFVTTKASGTGLGLPISKKLVETLGGTLRIAAAAPRGTKAELAFHGTHSYH